MSKIKIVTDSASDILDKYIKEYDIEVLPFKIAVGDKSYVSNEDFDNEKFDSYPEDYKKIYSFLFDTLTKNNIQNYLKTCELIYEKYS